MHTDNQQQNHEDQTIIDFLYRAMDDKLYRQQLLSNPDSILSAFPTRVAQVIRRDFLPQWQQAQNTFLSTGPEFLQVRCGKAPVIYPGECQERVAMSTDSIP